VRLLLFIPESENEIDEVLMVVPDDYDREHAIQEAEDVIGKADLASEIEIEITGFAYLSMYRPYVG
jgi:hypothetical protein